MKKYLLKTLLLAMTISLFGKMAFSAVGDTSSIHLVNAIPQSHTALYPTLEIVQDAYDMSILYGIEEDEISIESYFTSSFDRQSFAKIFRMNHLPMGTYTKFTEALALKVRLPNAHEYAVHCKFVSEQFRTFHCTFKLPTGTLPAANHDGIISANFVINIEGIQSIEDSAHLTGTSIMKFPPLDLKNALPLYLTTYEDYGAPDADHDGVFDDIDKCADQSEVYAADGSIADGIEDGCPNNSAPVTGGAGNDDSSDFGPENTDSQSGGGACSLNTTASVHFSNLLSIILGITPLFFRRRTFS